MAAQMFGPFSLDAGDLGGAYRNGLGAAGCDAYQPGPAVRGICHAFDVAGPLELIDQEAGGLLGDLGSLGEFGEPRAVWPDPLKYACLCSCEVVEPGGGQGGEHSVLQSPVGDEQQQPEIQLAGRVD